MAKDQSALLELLEALKAGGVIAAIFGTHRATLVTRNVQDFEHTRVTLVDPWRPM